MACKRYNGVINGVHARSRGACATDRLLFNFRAIVAEFEADLIRTDPGGHGGRQGKVPASVGSTVHHFRACSADKGCVADLQQPVTRGKANIARERPPPLVAPWIACSRIPQRSSAVRPPPPERELRRIQRHVRLAGGLGPGARSSRPSFWSGRRRRAWTRCRRRRRRTRDTFRALPCRETSIQMLSSPIRVAERPPRCRRRRCCRLESRHGPRFH
ncbi:hypothetical protein SAMN04487915_101870 [Arthrobacter sp. ov118]|nr:hypothetical protein SAMN04487915_101870 [Arthrobacter sp. ov118]